MKKRLRNLLLDIVPSEELDHIYNSYDIIGDIAIIRLTDRSRKYGQIIAETVMDVHRKIRAVLAQTSPVRGDFRLRKLDFIAGEDRTTTVHKESGCLFSVDLEKCYFSPRLLYERMRIAERVGTQEVIVNMFAGVGCFSIIIAKHSQARKIYSIDINPTAFRFMQENAMLNRVYGKVIPMKGDAKEVIKKELRGIADRVLMPLPQKALQYLPCALSALRQEGGLVHCYLFEHADRKENPIQKAKRKANEKLGRLGVAFEFDSARIVRTIGPRWYQVVLDTHII